MNNSNIVAPQEVAERVKRELQERLAPYYERLAMIKSLKEVRILVNPIEKSTTFDYGEDTQEEKHIKAYIANVIKETRNKIGQYT